MVHAIVPHKSTGQPGPAMARLRPRQRTFVHWILEFGGNTRHNTQAARNSGYSGNDGTLGVTAHRLMHDPLVLAAIKEEAEKRLHSGLILGTSVVLEIASDPLHKDRLKAALEIMNRSGLHAKTEHQLNINDNRTDKEVMGRIAQLAGQLGVDPRKLLGYTPIDAEFVEVKNTSAKDAATDAVAELKDLL